MTRAQYTVLVDDILDPFDTFNVSITGMFEN